MNLKYYFWHFDDGIPENICDQITKFGTEKAKKEKGITGHFGKKLIDGSLSEEDEKQIELKRKSYVSFFSEPWVYKTVHPFIRSANYQAGWNFDWDWSEACQFTEYEKNQFYDWHCDSWDEPYNEPDNINRNNKVRKLSVTCLLSDPKDFKGGDLEFNVKSSEGKNVIIKPDSLKKGSVIVFPSFVWHRVSPIKEGIRKSLVVWNLGYSFR